MIMVSKVQKRILRMGLAFAVSALMAAAPALADSFKQALLNAYRSNPTLQGDRARQRGTDELVPAAKSGWRPTITAQGTISRNFSDTNPGSSSVSHPKNLTIQLNQPLFRGFKTVEGVAQAKETVEAGRQGLLATEQNVLLGAVEAYMNVVRDRRILELRNQNVVNLQRQASAAQARFNAGEVTRTDVSQARARVSGAKSLVATAQASLADSSSRYAAIIGNKPGKLSNAPVANMPKSLEASLSCARSINPNILAAMHTPLAQEHGVEVTKGDLLPQASLQATASLTADPANGIETSRSAEISGVVTVPIYEAGRTYAAVRQAKQIESQRRIEVIGATRGVVQGVTSAWYFVSAARQAISSAKAQVSASLEALNGVRQEYLVGSRSTIDVLNAEQEMINSRISLVVAEHDLVVASYQLLAAVGKLTARNLNLGGPYYDVKENYNAVTDKWIGTDVETVQ
ncbi:MAG: TolC family outer membrane protein [Hyphomicrobiales bacterium]